MSEMHPPEGDSGRGEPLPFAGMPPEEPKRRRMDPGFALLGFFTPWVANALILWVLTAAADALSNHPRIQAYSPGVLEVAIVGGMWVAWVWGRRNGNNKLRSFGLGGLIAYAVAILLSLLVFGACWVILSGFNPTGN